MIVMMPTIHFPRCRAGNDSSTECLTDADEDDMETQILIPTEQIAMMEMQPSTQGHKNSQ